MNSLFFREDTQMLTSTGKLAQNHESLETCKSNL
jgi:hypothetical protein